MSDMFAWPWRSYVLTIRECDSLRFSISQALGDSTFETTISASTRSQSLSNTLSPSWSVPSIFANTSLLANSVPQRLDIPPLSPSDPHDTFFDFFPPRLLQFGCFVSVSSSS